MEVIDPDKIAEQREMIDWDVAQVALENDCARTDAYWSIAAEELHTNLQLQSWNGWWTSVVIPTLGYYSFHGPTERVAGGYLTPQEAAQWIVGSTLVGRDPETLALASLLRLVDARIDIAMDYARFCVVYGAHSVREIAFSISEQLCDGVAPNQQLLFTGRSYDDSLELAAWRIAPHLKQSLMNWSDRCGERRKLISIDPDFI